MQLELPSFNLPARWPLVPIDVAAFFLDKQPEELRLECESTWAWDIAAPDATRREIRIWRNCLLAAKDKRLVISSLQSEVLDSFLRGRGMRGTELQDLFYCTTQHIAELDAAGLLQVERGAAAVSGPRASKLYSRESIVSFLTSRSLGGILATPARN